MILDRRLRFLAHSKTPFCNLQVLRLHSSVYKTQGLTISFLITSPVLNPTLISFSFHRSPVLGYFTCSCEYYSVPLYKEPLLKGSGCNLTCLEARMKASAAKVAASKAAIPTNGIAHLTAQAPGLYLANKNYSLFGWIIEN